MAEQVDNNQPIPVPPPADNEPSILDVMEDDAGLNQALNEFRLRNRGVLQPIIEEGPEGLPLQPLNLDTMRSCLITMLNGDADLTQQAVMVEYLTQDQKLVIPSALGMSTTAAVRSYTTVNEVLLGRYWRLALTPYATIKQLVGVVGGRLAAIAAVDATQLPERLPEAPLWHDPNYYRVAGQAEDVPSIVTMVFSQISNWLQFNCDVRDMGALTWAEMTLPDNAWQDILPVGRLRPHLKPFSVKMLAALNYAPCGNLAMAGLVRAYGVSCGVLPHIESRCMKEYRFTTRYPDVTIVNNITAFEKGYPCMFAQISLNVLGMFGLFHLAKDHTFKTGDANMLRIGASYLNTIRTMVPSDLMETLKAHQEIMVRTVSHPFGLGQTYAVARTLAERKHIASPLGLRVTVTPPKVQRIMITLAAVEEWTNIPGGRAINDAFLENLHAIADESVRIKSVPPAYSGLYHLYGLDAAQEPSEAVMTKALQMYAIVYGYAKGMHFDDHGKPDGIALALSVQNVAQKQALLAKMYENMWESYITGLQEEGLVSMAQQLAITSKQSGSGV